MKIGDTRWRATIDSKTGALDWWQYKLRTIRKPWGYLTVFIQGVTWIKLSGKAGDYGWDPKMHSDFRERFLLDKGMPYSPTKRGAMINLVAELRSSVKEYGADARLWEDDVLTLGQELERALAAQKRVK